MIMQFAMYHCRCISVAVLAMRNNIDFNHSSKCALEQTACDSQGVEKY